LHQTSDASSFHDPNPRVSPFVLAAIVFSISLVHLASGCDSRSPSVEPLETPTSSGQVIQSEGMQPPEIENVPSPTAQHAPRDYLVEVGVDIPDNLNPLAPENRAAQRVTENMFDCLLRVNAINAAPEPGLAASWEIGEDVSSITFHLRPGISWHDGQPFTAKDVEFTFDSIRQPASESSYRANLANVKHFSATDSLTFVVDLKSPDCSTLYAVGQIPIISWRYFNTINTTGQNEPAANLQLDQVIGTGPYRLKDRLPNGEIRLERNESYFYGIPQIPEWVYQPVNNQIQILYSLRSGQADLALIPVEGIPTLQATGQFRFVGFPQARFYALILNNKHPFLNDVRVRQALAHAIDRAQLVQELLGGYGQVIESSWLPEHWAYAKPNMSFPFDPERAAYLLQEAGWVDRDGDGLLEKDGKKLRVNISVNAENDLRKRIALAVQQYWINIGVSVEIHFVEFNTLLEKLFAPNFDAVVFSWPIHADPDQHLLWASSEGDLQGTFNFMSYANPAVDEALSQGLIAPRCDPKLRAQAYQTAISAITSEQPYILLFVPQDILAVNRRVSGLALGPYAGLGWNIESWRLDTDVQ